MKFTSTLQCMHLALLFLLFSIVSLAQGIPVRGTILNAEGQPLAGVTVQVKGSDLRTLTDSAGAFQIAVPSANATLVFTYVGFAEQQVPLNNRTQINIAMTPQENALETVVVVGYGTQRKSDVTGALTSISAKTLQERPVQNVLQAMQGKAAGVQVSSNFRPGELPVLRVRGERSLGASNDPLYVVDGIPLVNALGVTSFSMNDINPNDIASIEILKDASATAIYGSRGANGVVLITTKKGQKGRVTIGYSGTVSLDSYKALTDWMSGGEWVDRQRLSLINGGQYNTDVSTGRDFNKPPTIWYPNPKWDSAMIGTADQVAIASVMMGYEWNPDGTVKMRPTTAEEQALGWPAQVPVYNSRNIRTFDWMDAATRQGITQNHNLSLTAGSNTSRIAISLGYYDQLGVLRDQDFNRYTANLSGDITPNKWLTLGTSIIASLSLQNYGILPPNTSNTGSKDLYSRATDQYPYALPYDADGFPIRNPGGNLNLWNPLIDIDQVKNERRTSAILTSLFSEIKFTSWLKYRLNFGVQYRHFRNGQWTGPEATSHLTNRPNTAGYATDENFSWVLENLLYFDKDFGRDHTLGVTLLQSSQKSRRENVSTSVSGLINPLSMWYDIGSNTVGQPGGYGSGFTENTLASFMGRINYALKNKYLLTVSGRADGASVLAPEHKWDFFPSFALAWKMQEEPFLRDIAWINELKPRFGYGVVGNSSVNPYTTSGPLSRNPYVFGIAAGIGYLPQLVQNPDLGWESTAQANIGLDFSLLRRRISGSVEVYEQKTSDLILPKTLPAVSGYVQKFENVGKTRNRGIEITLSTTNIDKGDFTWSTDINYTRNKEEILELLNGKEDMVANNWFIGQPLQVFRQYDHAGVWGSSSKDLEEMAKFRANGVNFYPGTVRVVDQNGDYNISGEDLVIRGSARPKWTGGLTNTFRYKNWSLNSFIFFRWGQTYFGGYPNTNRVENDIWSWENQNARWPMPNSNGGAVSNFTGAMQYNDGSFGVVRHITLAYTVPKNFIERISVNDLALSIQVLNPFIFGPGVVKWGINPDDDTNWERASTNTNPLGGTNSNAILPQSVVFGLRAGF